MLYTIILIIAAMTSGWGGFRETRTILSGAVPY